MYLSYEDSILKNQERRRFDTGCQLNCGGRFVELKVWVRHLPS